MAINMGSQLQMKDLSLRHWQDKDETKAVDFSWHPAKPRTGTLKRQYRQRHEGEWTIFTKGYLDDF